MPGATTRAIRAMEPAYSSPTLGQEFSMVPPEFCSFFNRLLAPGSARQRSRTAQVPSALSNNQR